MDSAKKVRTRRNPISKGGTRRRIRSPKNWQNYFRFADQSPKTLKDGRPLIFQARAPIGELDNPLY